VSALYVGFSPAEFERRWRAVEGLLDDHELDGIVVFGWSAMGRAVQADVHYLSGYLGMRDNYVVKVRGEAPVLLAQSYNHVPNARDVSVLDDVRWGGPNSGATAGELVRSAGCRRVGVVGMMPYQHHAAMLATASESSFLDVTGAYRMLRTVKSAEELAWLRAGAEHTDRAVAALEEQLRPGLLEWQVGAIIEDAYRDEGGMTVFHYVASTPMSAPERCVPSQVLSDRRIEIGDVVTVEISAAHHGYAGQSLRTYVVGAEPDELFSSLYACAEEVFLATLKAVRTGATTEAVFAAGDLVVEAGFTIRDSLLHGFGMGILPPNIGTRETPHANEDWTFRANETLVVQPNVITRDERAGVQTGELCVVTDEGLVSLHSHPMRLSVTAR
jgi:Xaa-Pro dipeptidase